MVVRRSNVCCIQSGIQVCYENNLYARNCSEIKINADEVKGFPALDIEKCLTWATVTKRWCD